MKTFLIGMLGTTIVLLAIYLLVFFLPKRIGLLIYNFYTQILKREWNTVSLDADTWFIGVGVEMFFFVSWIVGYLVENTQF
jgi:predicted Co/Zn/Cd cation transporter (cation efflux family)